MKGWATAKYLQRFSTSVSLQLYKLHINPFTQSPMCKYQKSTLKWSWWWLDSIFNQPQIFPFNKSWRTNLRKISFDARECIKWRDFLKILSLFWGPTTDAIWKRISLCHSLCNACNCLFSMREVLKNKMEIFNCLLSIQIGKGGRERMSR